MVNIILAKEGISLVNSLDFEYFIRKKYLPSLIVCKAFGNESTARYELLVAARNYAESNLGSMNMSLFIYPAYLAVNQPYLFPDAMQTYISQKIYPQKSSSQVDNIGQHLIG